MVVVGGGDGGGGDGDDRCRWVGDGADCDLNDGGRSGGRSGGGDGVGAVDDD